MTLEVLPCRFTCPSRRRQRCVLEPEMSFSIFFHLNSRFFKTSSEVPSPWRPPLAYLLLSSGPFGVSAALASARAWVLSC